MNNNFTYEKRCKFLEDLCIIHHLGRYIKHHLTILCSHVDITDCRELKFMKLVWPPMA